VDELLSEDYVNHNDFIAGGREPNRGWWNAFFTGLPDVSVTMDDLISSGTASSDASRIGYAHRQLRRDPGHR
jgi:hypothetical protein